MSDQTILHIVDKLATVFLAVVAVVSRQQSLQALREAREARTHAQSAEAYSMSAMVGRNTRQEAAGEGNDLPEDAGQPDGETKQ